MSENRSDNISDNTSDNISDNTSENDVNYWADRSNSNDSDDSDFDYFDLIESKYSFMNQICKYLEIEKFTKDEIYEMIYELEDNNYFILIVYNVKFKELKYLLDVIYFIIYIIDKEILDNNINQLIKINYSVMGDRELIKLIESLANIIMKRNKNYKITIMIESNIAYLIKKIEY
jgi:hypothetical protein